MIILDSSCWISIFKGDPGAEEYVNALDKSDHVLVPGICIYEVGKFLIREIGEARALEAIASMKQYKIISVDADISLDAAYISLKYKMPFADSIIYAIAKRYNAILYTRDTHFKKLDSIKYFGK